MLDIRLIREQPDFVKSRLTTRGGDEAAKIDEVLRVDAELRKTETALQQLQAERNRRSKEIGAKRGRGESTEELEAQVQDGIERFVELDGREIELRKRRQDLLWQIPNLPHANSPVGKDANDNPVVRS